jgi:transposase
MIMPKPLKSSVSKTSSSARPAHEVEVPRSRAKRKFSMAERQRIIDAAEACAHGELGALLRREGIYHTQLSEWRAKIKSGIRIGNPGPVPKLDAKDKEIALLKSKVSRLTHELGIVNGLVELQKKVQAMFSTTPQSANA